MIDREYREYSYKISTLRIVSEGKEEWEREFLYHPKTRRFYEMTKVEGEWKGRYLERFCFRFTEESKGYDFLDEMVDEWLLEMDGYPMRTKEYLRSGWMRMRWVLP